MFAEIHVQALVAKTHSVAWSIIIPFVVVSLVMLVTHSHYARCKKVRIDCYIF